jgi:leucyl/phenylalanyl-tRNA--protein transferase
MQLPDTILEKRETLFRETILDYAERIAFGTAWALQPKRIRDLPALAGLCLTELAFPTRSLPDPRRQLSEGGLCGIIREPTAEKIIAGYKLGLFTFAHYGPLKWISLPKRNVLFF